jgi:hypothetical protein
MFHKQAIALPTAAHAMRLMEKKESTHKELDTSALLVISVLPKILNSTNSLMHKKPQLEKPLRIPHAFLTTKDQKILEASVSKVSTHAPITVASVQVPQEPLLETYDMSFFIASLLYLLINFPRNYSLVHFII